MKNNIIKMGSTYKVFGEGVEGVDKLPNTTLLVSFSDMSGYSLEEQDPFVVTKKIYGSHEAKADKVLKSFEGSKQNLGVMYGGLKGTGKSISSQLIAQRANENGYPVLIVKNDYPGLNDFLNSIQQEIVVIFDEFEKSFKKEAQDALLNLFDGFSYSKKLFVITYNEEHKLTPYVKSRPGRFRYRFNFDTLSDQIIEEYLLDNLTNPNKSDIKSIQFFNGRIRMTFDYLNAICAELNQGYSLSETMEDLNIDLLADRKEYVGTLEVEGKTVQFNFESALSDSYKFYIRVKNLSEKVKDVRYAYLNFEIPTVAMDLVNGEFIVNSNKDIKFDVEYDRDEKFTEEDIAKVNAIVNNIDTTTIKFKEESKTLERFDISKLTV